MRTTDVPLPKVVGLIGAGGIANAHLPAWLELGVEVVVYSTDDRAPALVAAHGGGEVAGSLDELLARAELVDVCTPTYTHPELVARAAQAGRGVICEKPLALTVEESLEMVRVCEAAGVPLYPAQVVRFFPAYRALQRSVAAGDLGTPAVLRFSRLASRPQRAWFHDPALSGGILLDQMIHDLDMARWLAGEVTQVQARAVTRDTEDGPISTAQAVLTHADGAISTVTGGWLAPTTTFRTTFGVAGTKGYLRYDSAAPGPVRVDAPSAAGTGGTLLPRTLGDSPFLLELAELGSACCGGSPARVSALDGVAAVALGLAANQSLDTGGAVTVADLRTRLEPLEQH